jgi:hypothetical protein
MEVNVDAQSTVADTRVSAAPVNLSDLWTLFKEHQARLERLEASLLPLPDATERVGAGRTRVSSRLKKSRSRFSQQPLSPNEAFQVLEPITSRYATVPIWDGFSWDASARRLKSGEWYMVVFRSVRREATDDLTLEMHDYGAYIEAQRRADGLVYYFRGTPNEHRECLSFCIWAGREEAARTAQLPLHRTAMSMVDEKYEWYVLERYSLVKANDRIRIDAVRLDATGAPLNPN